MRVFNKSTPNADCGWTTGGILLVDGCERVRRVVPGQLAPLDVEVVTAADSNEARSLLEGGFIPDVVILDYELPDSSGLALCRYLRARGSLSSVYVVMLTGHGGVTRVNSLHGGADDYLSKPYDLPTLIASVRSGLRVRAMARVMMRKARRDAMAWLAMVTAHEINNPLAVVLANLSHLRYQLDKPEPRNLGDALKVIEESTDALERIREASSRLQRNHSGGSGVACWVTAQQLESKIRAILEAGGIDFELSQKWIDCDGVEIDAPLLLEGVKGIVEASASRCGGPLNAQIHIDESRAVILLDFAGSPEDEAESILEPALIESDQGPPRYEPGLSLLEARFVEQEGQIFAARRRGHWHFGVMLPVTSIVEPQAMAS